MISVMIAAIWLRVGFNMVIYLAGLQGISPELYEAATHRRRQPVAAVPLGHRAARRPEHVLPADHERHRVVPGVRRHLRHDRRRPGQRDIRARAPTPTATASRSASPATAPRSASSSSSSRSSSPSSSGRRAAPATSSNRSTPWHRPRPSSRSPRRTSSATARQRLQRRRRRGADGDRKGIVWRTIIAVVVCVDRHLPAVLDARRRVLATRRGLRARAAAAGRARSRSRTSRKLFERFHVFHWFGNSVVIGAVRDGAHGVREPARRLRVRAAALPRSERDLPPGARDDDDPGAGDHGRAVQARRRGSASTARTGA